MNKTCSKTVNFREKVYTDLQQSIIKLLQNKFYTAKIQHVVIKQFTMVYHGQEYKAISLVYLVSCPRQDNTAAIVHTVM